MLLTIGQKVKAETFNTITSPFESTAHLCGVVQNIFSNSRQLSNSSSSRLLLSGHLCWEFNV